MVRISSGRYAEGPIAFSARQSAATSGAGNAFSGWAAENLAQNAKAPLPPLNGTVQDEPHLFAQVHGLLFDDQLLDVVLETLRSALVVDGDADGGGRWLDAHALDAQR